MYSLVQNDANYRLTNQREQDYTPYLPPSVFVEGVTLDSTKHLYYGRENNYFIFLLFRDVYSTPAF